MHSHESSRSSVAFQRREDVQRIVLRVVYFAWLNPESAFIYDIIQGQLEDLLQWTRMVVSMDTVILSIVVTGSSSMWDLFCQRFSIVDQLKEHVAEVEVRIETENNYEFPAISLLYHLACSYPHDVFLYLHSKGVLHRRVYHDPSQEPPSHRTDTAASSRDLFEQFLTRKTLASWASLREPMQKGVYSCAGLFLAQESFGPFFRFNFFYASGEYLQTCTEPYPSLDRFVYERWLQTGDSQRWGQFWSVLGKEEDHRFDMKEVHRYIEETLVSERSP